MEINNADGSTNLMIMLIMLIMLILKKLVERLRVSVGALVMVLFPAGIVQTCQNLLSLDLVECLGCRLRSRDEIMCCAAVNKLSRRDFEWFLGFKSVLWNHPVKIHFGPVSSDSQYTTANVQAVLKKILLISNSKIEQPLSRECIPSAVVRFQRHKQTIQFCERRRKLLYRFNLVPMRKSKCFLYRLPS